jgi:hypothetical protein
MQVVLEEMSGNVVVSPVSVATLLSLLQQGSGGNTEAQLTEVLNLKTQQSRQGYSRLARNLKVKQWREKMGNFFTQLKEVDLGRLFYFISGLNKDADSSFTITLRYIYIHTHTHTHHSIRLLWLSDRLEAGTSTLQHTTFIKYRHICPWRDSNPQPQQDPRLRTRGLWDRQGDN